MSEHLEDQPQETGDFVPPAPESDEALTARLAAFDEKLAAGEVPSTADPDDSREDEPDIRLRQKLDCLRLLDKLRPGRAEAASEFPYLSGDSSWQHGNPTRIGRFQIRRKLGHGGFGAVYLAYDPKLRRQVALKVPHPRTILTNELRERFKREAETAAVLDHRNVVPVYESGEAGPLCYIASAYCPGISLAGWLRDQTAPVPARLAASLTAQIADGVNHAHERGVLHRDLKPGNVLLTPIKAGKPIEETPTVDLTPSILANISDFHPRITDFGMAKRVGEWESDGSLNEDPAAPLTKTGAVMGTPAYMAPEQAAGRTKDVSPATDVHGLGVILYEMLTGKPPFLAESSSEIIRRVQTDEPLSPRKLRPKLPRDLETICLKCLEKEPRRRYQTAGELADDLRCFLDGKTIRARSVGKVERAWRWSNRQPLVAGLLMSLFVVVVSAIVGLWTLWLRERHQAELARQGQSAALTAQAESAKQTAAALKEQAAAVEARKAEAEARKEVEASLVELKSGLAEFTDMAMKLPEDPHVRGFKQSTLQRLLRFHQRFLHVKSNDPAAIYDAASAYEHVAGLQVELGRLDDAENSYKETVALCKRLAAFSPQTAEYRRFRSACLYRYGWFMSRRRGDVQAAFKYYDEGLNVIRDLYESVENKAEYSQMYIVLLGNWASTKVALGDLKAAKPAYETVLRLEKETIRANPAAFNTRESHALTHMTYAHLMELEGKPEEAERLLREAVRLMREVLADGSDYHGHRYTLCRLLDSLAHTLHVRKKYLESEVNYREAVDISRRLVQAYPYMVDYQEMFADVAADLGHDLSRQRRNEAHDLLVESINATRSLMNANAEPRYRFMQARGLNLILNRCEKKDSAEYIGYARRLLDLEPTRWLLTNELARLLLCGSEPELRNPGEALRLTDGLLLHSAGSLNSQNTRGIADYRTGNYRKAKERFELGIDHRWMPHYPDYIFMAMTLKKMGDDDAATRYRDMAARVLKVVPAFYRSDEWGVFQREADELFAGKPATASRESKP